MRPLTKSMDDIMTGKFSAGMMDDWNDDKQLLSWRRNQSNRFRDNG